MCKCDNLNIHKAYQKPCSCSDSVPCLEPGQFISWAGPLPYDILYIGAVVAWIPNLGFYLDPELKIEEATYHWLLVNKSSNVNQTDWVKIRKVS